MAPINWFRVGSTVALIVLLALMLYGDYQYYFQKPTPIVNNYAIASGANFKQVQGSGKNSGRLFTGLGGGKDSVFGVVGWIW